MEYVFYSPYEGIASVLATSSAEILYAKPVIHHVMPSITAYILTLVPLVIIDAIWLGVIARSFYAKHLGHLLTENVVWSAAGIFYLIYAAGLMKFVVLPGLDVSLQKVALNGALFGVVAYATYELTNMATLSGWSWNVVIADIIWGAALSGATAMIAVWLLQRAS